MKSLGFSDTVVQWFKLHLTNNKFFASLNNMLLEVCSIIGGATLISTKPFLIFVIHKNDIPQAASIIGS